MPSLDNIIENISSTSTVKSISIPKYSKFGLTVANDSQSAQVDAYRWLDLTLVTANGVEVLTHICLKQPFNNVAINDIGNLNQQFRESLPDLAFAPYSQPIQPILFNFDDAQNMTIEDFSFEMIDDTYPMEDIALLLVSNIIDDINASKNGSMYQRIHTAFIESFTD